jgi:hypothetical protein
VLHRLPNPQPRELRHPQSAAGRQANPARSQGQEVGTRDALPLVMLLKRLIPATALVLGLTGGIASADRVVVEHRGPVVRGGYARRPIYVRRPVIGEHYYNRYHRPTLIVEDYGPRPGYVWVRGHWGWNGGEWMWAPGYYNPL